MKVLRKNMGMIKLDKFKNSTIREEFGHQVCMNNENTTKVKPKPEQKCGGADLGGRRTNRSSIYNKIGLNWCKAREKAKQKKKWRKFIIPTVDEDVNK